jgi:hypothetical protein
MRLVAVSLGAAVTLGICTTPVAAQLNSIPVYTSPKGGTGISVFADYGKGINEESGKNRAIAARGVLGLAMLQLGVGIGTVNPEIAGARENKFQWMATAALRVIGGGVMPLAVNVQAGYGRVEVAQDSTEVNIPISIGVGFSPPIPGLTLELWGAPRYSIRDLKVGDLSVSQNGFGISAGVNLGFSMGLGVHAALDWEYLGEETGSLLDLPSTKPAVFGVGISYNFKLPGGV